MAPVCDFSFKSAAGELAVTSEPKTRKRTNSRSRVLMTGNVVTADGSHQVLLRDISQHGARICAGNRISAGQDAYLRRGPIFLVARIAWSRSNEAGLEFYREMTHDDLARAFHRVIFPQDAD
jgi:hypothetical protein